MSRTADVERKTKETTLSVHLDLDGGGTYDVQTANPFLTHMVETWTRYAGFGVRLRASGDLDHHLVEDVGIALGQAFRAAFALAPCQRIAYDIVPMDDALVLVAVDLVDRPYYEGVLPIPLWEHFLRSFAMEARINLHVDVQRGRDTHHCVEAALKAFARALRKALEPRDQEVSTKGTVQARVRAAPPAGMSTAPHLPGTAAQRNAPFQPPVPSITPAAATPPPPTPAEEEERAIQAAEALSLEEEELEALASDPASQGWSWREGSIEPKVHKSGKDLEVRKVGKDGRPRLEAKGKRRKTVEDAGMGTIVAPAKLGNTIDTGPLPDTEDTAQDAGGAHVKPESLAAASHEVSKKLSKRDLPEVKAAKARDREIHGDDKGDGDAA